MASAERVTKEFLEQHKSWLAATAGSFALLLDGWGYRAVGAIHAAVAGQWFEEGVAAGAFVKPLAGVDGHLLGLRMLADGLGEHSGDSNGMGR